MAWCYPGRRQAIIWINAGILLIGPLGINFSEILIKINTFSFKKTYLKLHLQNGVYFSSVLMIWVYPTASFSVPYNILSYDLMNSGSPMICIRNCSNPNNNDAGTNPVEEVHIAHNDVYMYSLGDHESYCKTIKFVASYPNDVMSHLHWVYQLKQTRIL